MAKVSVIIPAYNQGHYLSEAIGSVLRQTYSDFELVVVDDGSTDNTKAVSEQYQDPRLIYIYQENRGLSAARNTGIRNSGAPYLTFLDSDDLFLPEKLALLYNYLEENPQVGFVAGQAIPIDEHGIKIGEPFDKPLPQDSKELLLGNPLHVGSVMLRRSWQEKVGFFDETLRSYEDWDLWLRLAQAGCKMGWVPQPVSLYRFHPAQMTRIGNQMTTATFAVLGKLFSNEDLSTDWLLLKNKAYSSAYLRAAAQAYHSLNYSYARDCLEKAITLDPDLMAENGQPLADIFSAWIDLPKTSEPLTYLENVYQHLPDQLSGLAAKRRQYLAEISQRMFYQAYQEGNHVKVFKAAWKARAYQSSWIFQRGTLSILMRSFLAWLRIQMKIDRSETSKYFLSGGDS